VAWRFTELFHFYINTNLPVNQTHMYSIGAIMSRTNQRQTVLI